MLPPNALGWAGGRKREEKEKHWDCLWLLSWCLTAALAKRHFVTPRFRKKGQKDWNSVLYFMISLRK